MARQYIQRASTNWQRRIVDDEPLFFDAKRPPKDRCCICGRRLEGEVITETRRTGPRFKNQTWSYCRGCAPSKPVQKLLGRRIG
jgi:hypothetical protein